MEASEVDVKQRSKDEPEGVRRVLDSAWAGSGGPRSRGVEELDQRGARGPSRGTSPPDGLRARILESVAREPPSPTHSHRARRAAWLLLTCCAVLGLELLLLLGPRRFGPALGGPWSTLAWGLGALLLAATVARRGDDSLGPPEWALWVVAALSLLVPGWVAS